MHLVHCVPYLCFLIDVPSKGDSIIGNFFNIPNGVEALLVISCNTQHREVCGCFYKTWSTYLHAQVCFRSNLLELHYHSLDFLVHKKVTWPNNSSHIHMTCMSVLRIASHLLH